MQDTGLPLSMSPRNTPIQRPNSPGVTLVAEGPHNKHGSSVFVRDGLKVNSISVCEEEIVEFITMELPSVVVQSLYSFQRQQPTSGGTVRSSDLQIVVISSLQTVSSTVFRIRVSLQRLS